MKPIHSDRELRNAIDRSLRSGHMVAELPLALRAFVWAREQAGHRLTIPELLVDVIRIVLEYERSERQMRDAFTRATGAADPVVSIADACVSACLAREFIDPRTAS